VSDRTGWTAEGRIVLEGSAAGTALVLEQPLSFWGGLDAVTGLICDERHPQRDESVAGRVVVMPAGRGSSSSSSVLAEAIRNGSGPVALLLGEPDGIIVLGALIPRLLDQRTTPVVVLSPGAYSRVKTGDHVVIDGQGVRVSPR